MEEAFLPYGTGCIEALFVRRHKRFSVLGEYQNSPIWVHSNNTGTMLGLLREGAPMLASKADNPKRKLAYTQEALWLGTRHVQDVQGFWVGVNTSVPNRMLAAAFKAKSLPFAAEYTAYTPEAKIGTSRMDALLTGENLVPLWIECKNVTLVEEQVAYFPDAVTERGQKHLQKLMSLVQSGQRAAMFYLVQRPDAKCFAPADFIDPVYAKLFCEAVAVGVEVYVFTAHVNLTGITLGDALPLARNCLS